MRNGKRKKIFSQKFLEVKSYIFELQETIRKKLEVIGGEERGEPFQEKRWRHRDVGGGKSLIIEALRERIETKKDNPKGKRCTSIFEKAGINVSAVGGSLPKSMGKILDTKAKRFSACGISLVIHPYSPLIPTIHMNVRYFEMSNGDFWFGGGVDLTPYYPALGDFKYFHKVVYNAVTRVYPNRYQEFKKKCDDYFTLPHRGEMRGIGGVFFDYLKNNYFRDFDLIRSLGDAFLECYLPIITRNLNKKFSERERAFQLHRRGRYVEFNLLYDRGTLFGLKTGGRVDSILMSLPTPAHFLSNHSFPKNGFESQMKKYYQPRNWVRG